VIHLASMTKVDIYCCGTEPLARDELARRIFIEVDGQRIPCASAEDIILQKLKWFAEGGQVSDRQGRDIRGVIKVQGDALEHRHADSLGLEDLRARAFVASI
jgi:hypothetical protein